MNKPTNFQMMWQQSLAVFACLDAFVRGVAIKWLKFASITKIINHLLTCTDQSTNPSLLHHHHHHGRGESERFDLKS